MSPQVKHVGEFALIEQLIAALPEPARGNGEISGQQDDCAYWTTQPGTSIVTTDALVEGVHFRLDWTDWFSLGHKMLAVNLSDLASMGCQPTLALVTLSLTGEEYMADLEELYRGAGELAAIYGVAIAGGDIVRTPGPFTISVTAFGNQPVDRPVMRRTEAKPGDGIFMSGTLGASAAGLQLLLDKRTDAATAELLVGAHLRPSPRISLGQALVRAGVTCCMDLSDGLSGDLPKILNASGVGARVHIERLPILPAVHALFPQDWQRLALHGGEDYELLFTAAPGIVDDMVEGAREVGATLTHIGEITKGGDMAYFLNGEIVPDRHIGAWDHFGKSNEE